MLRLIGLVALMALAACAGEDEGLRPGPRPGTIPLESGKLTLLPVSYSDLPGWRDDDMVNAWAALKKTCDLISTWPTDRAVGQNGLGGVAADWSGPCGALQRVSSHDAEGLRTTLQNWFAPYRVTDNGRAEGLFTGYYEAEIRASRSPSGRYRFPIYGKPRDLVFGSGEGIGRMVEGRLVPYYTRHEIEAGALVNKASPLLYAEDSVDLFIMQIQGSGRAILDDGTVVHLSFSAHNGRPFVAIGKAMKERGLTPPNDSSMQSVRAWLKSNPGKAPLVMEENPHYVFFRINPVPGDGPVGAMGIPLTPGRSLAVDGRFIPLGVPLWLDSLEPNGTPLRRLMVAQDTGTAIKGAVRGDLFWGYGEQALEKAGKMHSRGSYFLLLPRIRSGRIAELDDNNGAAGVDDVREARS